MSAPVQKRTKCAVDTVSSESFVIVFSGTDISRSFFLEIWDFPHFDMNENAVAKLCCIIDHISFISIFTAKWWFNQTRLFHRTRRFHQTPPPGSRHFYLLPIPVRHQDLPTLVRFRRPRLEQADHLRIHQGRLAHDRRGYLRFRRALRPVKGRVQTNVYRDETTAKAAL